MPSGERNMVSRRLPLPCGRLFVHHGHAALDEHFSARQPSRPYIRNTYNRQTGDFTVTYDGEFMRERYEERRKFKEENPELWRKQIMEKAEGLQKRPLDEILKDMKSKEELGVFGGDEER